MSRYDDMRSNFRSYLDPFIETRVRKDGLGFLIGQIIYIYLEDLNVNMGPIKSGPSCHRLISQVEDEYGKFLYALSRSGSILFVMDK